MSKNKGKQQPVVAPPTAAKAVFKICDLFASTFKEKTQVDSSLLEKFENFKKTKENDPLARFGGSDRLFVSGAPLRNAIPGENLGHAHLTQDLSVVYSISGKNPTIVKLYGVFTHAELGTGTPPKIKTQQQMAKTFSNQRFT
jgi:hypothetical protein